MSTLGLGVMCSSTGIFYHNFSEEKIGVAAGLTITGAAIYFSGELLQLDNKNEYNLKKKNPYIDKNTKFEDMAKDYCKMKKWIREKV